MTYEELKQIIISANEIITGTDAEIVNVEMIKLNAKLRAHELRTIHVTDFVWMHSSNFSFDQRGQCGTRWTPGS